MSLSSLSGLSGLSSIFGSVPQVPPSAPNLSLSSISASLIRLTYTATGGNPSSYDAEIKGGAFADWTSLFTDETSGSYDATGLAANTQYEFRVLATNDAGDSDWSTIQSEYTWFGTPTADAAASVNWYSASLTYSDGSNSTSVAVEHQLQRNAGAWTSASPFTGSTFALLAPNSTYKRRLRHSDGRVSAWSNEVEFNTTTNDPASFAASTGSSSGEINLSWTVDNTGTGSGGTFSSVDIERCGDSGGAPDGNWTGVGSYTGTSTIDGSLTPGTTYWYRARTTFYNNSDYFYGDWQQTSGVAQS